MKTTALSLPPIAKQVPQIITEAEALTISNSEELNDAVTYLSKLNKKSDEIDAEKDKMMRPLLDAVAVERGRWKPVESLLAPVILGLRRKISDYQTRVKREEEEQKAKIAARVGEGKGKLSYEKALEKTDAVEVAEKRVATGAGSVTFKTEKMFEVIDLKALPLDYHLPNDTEIRKSMKAGKELPGVKYWTEEVPVNRR